jgi:signal transduction histidine kinase
MTKQMKRRRLYRLFLQPRFQLKYGAYFMTIAISSLVCSSLITVYITMKLLSFVHQQPESDDIFKIFMGFVLHNPISVGGSFGLMAIFYFFLAVVFTKRIVGPVQVLVKHVDALKMGDYHHKTTLRKDDDLKTLMVALNELSDSLQQRHNHKESAEPKVKLAA